MNAGTSITMTAKRRRNLSDPFEARSKKENGFISVNSVAYRKDYE